jgi:hypothetical protein
MRLRREFLQLFREYVTTPEGAAAFFGITAEALFIGTVLHSLDHSLMGFILPDPLFLCADDPAWQGMEMLGRVVRAGFVDNLPGLVFNVRCRDAPAGSFFARVYTVACSIDQTLADFMDCAIVK